MREIGGLFVIEATAQPGRRPGQGGARGRRGGGPIPAPRARRAAELQRVKTGYPRGLHPRDRAHRRVRRQVGRAGAGRGVRRPSRLLQDPAAARIASRHGRAGPGGGQPLAVRRRLHARGASLRRAPGRRRRAWIARSCPDTGTPPDAQLPAVRARDAVQRARDRARDERTAIPQVAASTCCSTPATPPTSSGPRARPAWPWRCWTRAPRPGRSIAISDELAPLGANLSTGSEPRHVGA